MKLCSCLPAVLLLSEDKKLYSLELFSMLLNLQLNLNPQWILLLIVRSGIDPSYWAFAFAYFNGWESFPYQSLLKD